MQEIYPDNKHIHADITHKKTKHGSTKNHNALYLVGRLVVHDELAVDEVETIRFGLERMVDHVLDYTAKARRSDSEERVRS